MRDFSIKTLGSRDSRGLKAKAAESGTLLFFAIVKHKARIVKSCAVARRLVKLSGSTWTSQDPWIASCDCSPRPLDRLVPQFLHARELAGIPWKPKVHLAVHLVLSAGRFGNPSLLGNWIDESDNRKLSLVASTAAAPVWHKRILSIFVHEAGPSASSTTKKPKH